MKGVIVDAKEKYVVLFNQECGFQKIARQPGMYVGLEINFNTSDSYDWKKWAARYGGMITAAAVVCILFFINTRLFTESRNVAFVDVDIGSSIEFTVNKDVRIVDMRDLSGDTNYVSDLNLKNASLEEAFVKLLSESKTIDQMKSGNEKCILISANYNNIDDKTGLKSRLKNVETMSNGLKKLISDDIVVKVVEIQNNDREVAKKNNMSMGRYSIYKEQYKNTKNITLEDAKNKPISEIISGALTIQVTTVTSKPKTSDKPKSTSNPQSSIIPQVTINPESTFIPASGIGTEALIKDVQDKTKKQKGDIELTVSVLVDNINQNSSITDNEKKSLIDSIMESKKISLEKIDGEEKQKIEIIIKFKSQTTPSPAPTTTPDISKSNSKQFFQTETKTD
jgi:hypothetical protein